VKPETETSLEAAADEIYAARPDWATGFVSRYDARYLLIRTVESGAERVVEIGTASGVSTAVLCHALSLAHAAGRVGAAYEVRTYDISTRFYADRDKATGAAAHEMLPPEIAEHVVFRNSATTRTAVEDLGPDALDLMFIDADHRHPWPTLDLLTALEVLRPGAEVILHDINLPARHPRGSWGAKNLFDKLDARKEAYEADEIGNIGSVWIPADKEAFREHLQGIARDYEWETKVSPEVLAPLLGEGTSLG
jgi:predicted O-methyltransferase YrrM